MQSEMTLRDQFAAAALNGLLARRDCYDHEIAALAWDMADAILRERCRSGGDCPLPDNAPNHDAAPAARADSPDERPPHAVSASGGTPSAASRDGSGTGDTQSFDAYRRFVGEVMNWISEATSAYAASCRSDGGRKIMADACSKCWDAFDRIATTDHGAAPEARARTDAERGRTDTPLTEPMPVVASSIGSVTPAGNNAEPAAWATFYPNGSTASVYVGRKPPHAEPLYRSPTLTAAEREAVECALIWVNPERQATLRGLLERLGGVE